MTTGHSSGGSLRPMGVLGLVWGTTLLIGGNELFRQLERRSPTGGERIAVVVLGVRHIAQGLLQVAKPHHFARLHAGVDTVHAASMAALALAGPKRRRAALASLTVASCAGWIAWRNR